MAKLYKITDAKKGLNGAPPEPVSQGELPPKTLVELEAKARKDKENAQQVFEVYTHQATMLTERLAKQINVEWKVNLKFVFDKCDPFVLNALTGEVSNSFHAHYNLLREEEMVGKVIFVRHYFNGQWAINLSNAGSPSSLSIEVEGENPELFYNNLIIKLARAKDAGRLEFMGLKPAAEPS